MRTLALLAPPALLLAACNPGFDPQYRVTDLRILAVHAEANGTGDLTLVSRADPAPADTVLLRALVANPLDRPGLRVRWFVCAPATPSQPTPCRDPTALRDVPSLLAAGALELPGAPAPATNEALAVALSALPTAVQQGIAAAFAAARTRAQQQPTYRCLAYVEVPVVVVVQADGREMIALKLVRLVASADPAPPDDAYTRNDNPVVGAAYRAPADEDTCAGGIDIAPPATFPAGRTSLCALPARGPQTYAVCAADGSTTPTTETFGWQWYVSAGEFPDVGGLGNAEGTHLVFDRPRGAFKLWLILRDGRGGDTWQALDVGPAP